MKQKNKMQGEWWNNYIGLPYKDKGRNREGIDCWGLVRLIHQDIFGNKLPTLSYEDTNQSKEEYSALEKENWIKVQNEQAGDVILFRLGSAEIHVGLVIQPCRFIHAFEGTDTCIESSTSPKWKKRIVGIYRYSEEARSNSVNTIPHPLRTEQIKVEVLQGLTLSELAKKVRTDNNVPEEYGDDAVIFVDGYLIPRENWDTYIPLAGSKVEYRATVGKGLGSIFKLAVMFAIAIYAPGLLAQYGGAAFGATAAGVTTLTTLGTATIFAISTVAGMMVDAIFPVRPPSQGNQSYINEQGGDTYTVRGGSNSPNRYGAIPVVLGTARFTPPSAMQPYYEADGTTSYLRNALCWGYGPLEVDMSTLNIGTTPVSNYSDIELAHLPGYAEDDKTAFEELVATDVKQMSVGASIDPVTTRIRYADRTSNLITATSRNAHSFSIGMDVILGSTASNNLHTGKVTSIVGDNVIFSNTGADLVLRADTGTAEASDWYLQGVNWHERRLQEEVTQVKVTLEFPQGLYVTNASNGAKSAINYKAIVQLKKTTDSWIDETTDSANSIKAKSFNIGALAADRYYSLYLDKDSILSISNSTTTYPEVQTTDKLIRKIKISKAGTILADELVTNEYSGFACSITKTTKTDSVASNDPENPFAVNTTNYTIITLNVATGYTSESLVTSFDITKKILQPFAQSVTFDVPSGIYDVRVKRLSTFVHNNYNSDRCVFSAITGYSNRKAITFPKPLCMTAVRAKATNQFNGNVEGFSAIVSSICLDYDYLTGTWVKRVSNNPASLYRHVLTHPANANPISPNKIDLAKLIEWHNYCRVNNFTYNNPHTDITSLNEVLKDVAAAGRASPSRVDGKYSIIIDKPRDYVSQHFTPHNSWGFDGSKILPKIPHGFRVQFNNEEKDYQQDELIVYADGYSELNAEYFEGISLPGVTNATAVYKHARFHLAQIILRPEVYSLNADIEHLVCNRGDLVKVTHDVPMWGLASGRIKAKLSDTSIQLNEDIEMQAGVSYSIRFRSQDGESLVKTVAAKVIDGIYDTIDVTTPFTEVEGLPDDIFMFGTVNQESNDLIVLKIEPSTNMTAKITLVDYSPDIYNIDAGAIPAFNSNISLPAGLLKKSINEVPIISSIEPTMQLEANGRYVSTLNIQFRNPASLPEDVKEIEIQWDWSGDTTEDWFSSNIIPISKGSYTISPVVEGDTYAIRARYIDKDGRSGNWSAESESKNYFLVSNTPVIYKDMLGIYTPLDASFSLKKLEGSTLVDYTGRFVISTSNNYYDYTDVYTSLNNESTVTFTVPAGTTDLKCRGYLSDGITLIDEKAAFITTNIEDISVVTAILTNESHNIPTDSAGNNAVFTGASTEMQVYVSGIDDSTNWTYSVSKVNVTCSEAATSRIQTITAIIADVGYVDITASKAGYSDVTKRFTVAKARGGANGIDGANPVIYSLYLNSPVIAKESSSAALSGVHSTVDIQGRRLEGTTETNYGWVTVTGNGQVEATTATNTSTGYFTLAPTTTAGRSNYTVRLYNQATVAGATLLDTQVIPVVFKGNTGTTGTNGTNGTRTAYLYFYQWKATQPTLFPSGSSNYNWLTGTYGAPTTPNSWTVEPNTVVAGATLWRCIMPYSDTNTSNPTSVGLVISSCVAVGKAGADGGTGTRGSITVYDNTNTTPSDALANAAIATVYASKVEGDAVIFTKATSNGYYKWVGGIWTAASIQFDGNVIVNGTLAADKLATGTLTAGKSISVGTTNPVIIENNASGYGNVRSGKTTYADAANTGFWLGRDSTDGKAKFFVGNQSDKHMKWDGTALTVGGEVIATSNVQSDAVVRVFGTTTTANNSLAANTATDLKNSYFTMPSDIPNNTPVICTFFVNITNSSAANTKCTVQLGFWKGAGYGTAIGENTSAVMVPLYTTTNGVTGGDVMVCFSIVGTVNPSDPVRIYGYCHPGTSASLTVHDVSAHIMLFKKSSFTIA